MRRCLLVCAIITLLVAPEIGSEGYVVILKSGHRIRASKPVQVQGEQALITLVSGTMTSIPVDQVDLIDTERYNQLGLGDAFTIDELDSLGPTPTPRPPARPSLGNLASIDDGAKAILGSTLVPSPTPTPGIQVQPFPYADRRVETAFTQIFDQRHMYLQYRTSAGTKSDFLFIQVVTNSQREVFQALTVMCEAYTIIHELDPDSAPPALELEMVTSVGKPAGTFRVTPELARQLNSGEVAPGQFYVQYVIF